MRKSVKAGLIVCLVLLIPAGLLMLPFAWEAVETELFYRARPILNEIRHASSGNSQRSDLVRSVLLAHFPIGSEASSAVAALSHAGFGCQKVAPRSVRPDTLDGALQKRAEELRYQLNAPIIAPEPTRMVCQLLAPAGFEYTRWILNFPIDDTGRLTGADVVIGHVSF